MNIKQLFRKLKAELHGVSNYKEVLDQSGNLQMYCGSIKAPVQIQMIFQYRGDNAKTYVKEVLDSLHKKHLVSSYEQFGFQDQGSVTVNTIKSNESIVRQLLMDHLSWRK